MITHKRYPSIESFLLLNMKSFLVLLFLSLMFTTTFASNAAFWKSQGFPAANPWFPNPFEDVYVSEDGFHSIHFSLPTMSLDRLWEFLFMKPRRDDPAQIPIPASFFDFIPAQVGSIRINEPFEWSSPCFKTLSMVLTFNETFGTVSISASQKTDSLCEELYSFCDREACRFKLLEIPGHHTL